MKGLHLMCVRTGHTYAILRQIQTALQLMSSKCKLAHACLYEAKGKQDCKHSELGDHEGIKGDSLLHIDEHKEVSKV